MKEDCKYRLPCGWCDRQNKKCEMNPITITPLYKKAEVDKHIETAISSLPKICGSCGRSTFISQIGVEEFVRCEDTSRIHRKGEMCDIVGGRQ